MQDIAKQIEDKIHKGQVDIAYDLIKLILFQKKTKGGIIRNKEGELLINVKI